MPKPTPRQPRIPSLRQHKPSGRAYVELNGRRRYLGLWRDPATTERYEATIAEWLVNGRRPLDAVDPNAITIVEICDWAIDRADRYYVDSQRRPTGEAVQIRHALRPLRKLYGRTPAAHFSPRKLKAVRQTMIDTGWCRNTINSQVNRLRRVFKWAVEDEKVAASVLHGLRAVDGLKRGRSDAPETEPVRPVPEHVIEATLPHLPPTVADMVRVQLLTQDAATARQPARDQPTPETEVGTGGSIQPRQLPPRRGTGMHAGVAPAASFGEDPR